MSDLHETLVDVFHDVNKLLHQHIRPVFQNLPLPPGAMMLGGQIRHNPGLTVSELSRRTGIAKSHVSNMLEEMNRRGWIEKRPDPIDHRLVRIYLAETGAGHMQQMHEEIRYRMAAAISGLPEDKARQLIAALQDFKEALAASPHEKRDDTHMPNQ